MPSSRRSARGYDPTIEPFCKTTMVPKVLRWQFFGSLGKEKARLVMAVPAERVGQTEAEAWEHYDQMMKGSLYTNVTAQAITEHGRITFARPRRAA